MYHQVGEGVLVSLADASTVEGEQQSVFYEILMSSHFVVLVSPARQHMLLIIQC
jgi:hypothetical protein